MINVMQVQREVGCSYGTEKTCLLILLKHKSTFGERGEHGCPICVLFAR